jgi:hypothetical protein
LPNQNHSPNSTKKAKPQSVWLSTTIEAARAR